MSKEKKPFYKRWWFWVIVIIIIISLFTDDPQETDDVSESSEEDIKTDKVEEDEDSEDSAEDELVNGYKVKHGELLSVLTSGENDEVAVFKVKIEPNLTKKLTIQQNAHNIDDLVLNQGADKFEEIQYWAVADMDDGSESKVISFDVNKETIKAITEKKVYSSELLDYVDNLWILPSLAE